MAFGIQESFVKASNNKKAFQSNANRPLAGSPGYVVNKFQHVREGKGGSCMVRSKLNKFELLLGGGWGWGSLYVKGERTGSGARGVIVWRGDSHGTP